MAGDWIKMRGALFQSPKVLAMARHLHGSAEFRDWLTPGGGGAGNGQIVSDDALRCVTCALLLRVWSASREFGKFDGDDLTLSHIAVADLDVMAGAPGVGDAMTAVGWAVANESGDGVTLPNFKQHNVPMTNADKQREYRRRRGVTGTLPRAGNATVTGALPRAGNKSVTREEKRREEKKEEKTPLFPPELDTEEFRRAWGEWKAERAAKNVKAYTPRGESGVLKHLAAFGPAVAVEAVAVSIRNGWQGLFPEKVKPPPAPAGVPARDIAAEYRAKFVDKKPADGTEGKAA